MVKHWVFVTKPENLHTCLKYRVFGVELSKYGHTAQKLIQVNDLFFFYVRSQKQAISLQSCGLTFIGPFMIKSPGTPNPKHSAVSEWDPAGKFTVIIEFGKVPNDPIGAVNLDDVSNDLLFITNKAKTGRGGRQDHAQFSIISIREEDYKLLRTKRQPDHPCINQLK